MLKCGWSLLVLMPLVAGAVVWALWSSADDSAPVSSPLRDSAADQGEGGATRPPLDVLPSASTESAAPTEPAAVDTVGRSAQQEVEAVATFSHANPFHQQVRETLRTGAHPERISQFAAVPDFDPEAFAQDPQAYLAQVVPMRAMQSVPATLGAPVIGPLTAGVIGMEVGVATRVGVRGLPPGAPVTFTALDGGKFVHTQLASVSVLADAQGEAYASYVPTPGTHAGLALLVGSPLAVGPLVIEGYVVAAHP